MSSFNITIPTPTFWDLNGNPLTVPGVDLGLTPATPSAPNPVLELATSDPYFSNIDVEDSSAVSYLSQDLRTAQGSDRRIRPAQQSQCARLLGR